MGLFTALFGINDWGQLTNAFKDGALLVDVRSPGEFASGSVANAINIPLDTIQSQLSNFGNKKNIIVFCRSGARSSQAKKILERNGIQNVLNGGAWTNVNKLTRNT